jgi:hypothetical protein
MPRRERNIGIDRTLKEEKDFRILVLDLEPDRRSSAWQDPSLFPPPGLTTETLPVPESLRVRSRASAWNDGDTQPELKTKHKQCNN